jgi:hypothetical protein
LFLNVQTSEHTSIQDLIKEIQGILYSTAEDVVVAPNTNEPAPAAVPLAA